ncbi:MAG: LysR family transcriptional regulator [Betaproteobacteria bacterium]|nr:LysR family transcriptional regulator [Betaproteobacteria bacterium]
MQDLNDLYYFAKVVEKGSFAAAARTLDLPKSRLSRRVATLESALGVRLLQRTTRRLALTEVGKLYYQHAQNVMAEAEAAVEAVERVREVPSGSLRVSCAIPVAQTDLARILPRFLAAYPQIRLDLIVTNRRIELIEEGVDIALRVRTISDEEAHLVTRRFRPAHGLIVVHSELLEAHGPIAEPEDLARIPVMGFGSADRKLRWSLVGANGEKRDVTLTARLTTDDFNVLRNAALAGLGATLLPSAYCMEDVQAGRLTPLLTKWSIPAATLQAVYVSRRGMVPAVRAFLDFLEENLGSAQTVADSPTPDH